MRLSTEVQTDIREFLQIVEVVTPFDVNGGCECGSGDEDCECRVMELTVACNDDGTQWDYQTGDNSFTGGAYSLPHWAVVYLSHRSDRDAVTEDVITELESLLPENR